MPVDSAQASTPAPDTRRGKNIVVCCDGTGNEFGPNNSNVVRLYTAILVDNEQVAYYHPGVGTMGAPTAKGKLGKWWTKTLGLAFGAGFRDNVLDAYRYLMETYDDGDRIYLFGFSRGAYTIRALAGMIYRYGLLCRGNEGHMPYVWRDFKDEVNRVHDQNAQAPAFAPRQLKVSSADEFKATFSHPNLRLHFVGLWDTVSSVGWVTEPLRLLYTAQNPAMQTARHAVSIDERRCFFRDNLWGPPAPDQDILQVWFPGVHSDIGGSYNNDGCFLSNNALRWLMTEAEAAGLRLHPERSRMVLGESFTGYEPAAHLYQPAPEPTFPELPHRSLRRSWLFLEILPHQTFEKRTGKVAYRIPLGRPREVPPGSLVHQSAFARMSDSTFDYRPPNLPEQALTPVAAPLPGTAADTTDLYRYQPTDAAQPSHPPDAASVVTLAATASTLLGVAILASSKLFRGRHRA